jgi:D-alanyl-D-alanine carboxypeptidase/D-alanyl-D-alanine-endopeptidase (penicillin-binding protein 4)
VSRALSWAVLPALLAAGTAWSAFRGVDQPDVGTAPAQGGRLGPAAATPVLSARRIPAVMAQGQVDDQLAADAGIIAGRLPATSCLRVDVGGHTLLSLRADQPFVPASNLKVLTALTALDLLGPDTTFRTEVRAGAPVERGVLKGDLYLVGGGDPLLATAEWVARSNSSADPRTSLEGFADAIAATGLKEVTGSIVGDDSRYDDQRYVASWPARYRAEHQTGPLSALSFNDGFVLNPHDPNRADPAPDPAKAAAQLLAELLHQRGVEVRGDAASGTTPAGTTVLASIESAPVRDVVGEATRESDNGTAELLLKELGHTVAGAGTTAAGTRVVTGHLAELGLPTEGLHMVDGSGLDPTDTLTCDLLVEVYRHVGPGSDLVTHLSLAGEDGTLERRFAGTPVQGKLHGKSGTINGVSSLSGVAVGGDGTPLSFAVVVNGPSATDDGPAEWEALARALVAYPAPVDLAGLGPLPAA